MSHYRSNVHAVEKGFITLSTRNLRKCITNCSSQVNITSYYFFLGDCQGLSCVLHEYIYTYFSNWKENNKTKSNLDVVTHTCNPSTWDSEAGDHHEFESGLGYTVSSRLPYLCDGLYLKVNTNPIILFLCSKSLEVVGPPIYKKQSGNI